MAASLTPSYQTIADIGEEHIIRRFTGSPLPEGTIGIGDDCAVMEGPGEQKRLISTDLIIEEVHFRRGEVNPGDLGYKALSVNLSDIAAMGGAPDGFFLSLALPGTLPASWLDRFRDGLMELAQKIGVPLLGGDTTRSPGAIMISVTVTGQVTPKHLKLRSKASPGDRLCVTGPLGDAAAGLSILANPESCELLADSHREHLIQRHCRPEPALDQGHWLGRQDAVHAMIDLSDGLLRDARHLAEQSGCHIDLALDQLPLSPAFEAFGAIKRSQEQVQGLAAAGGEDYHLLLSVAGEFREEISRAFERQFGTPLYAVGSVKEGPPNVRTLRNGSPAEVHQKEFKHFNRS